MTVRARKFFVVARDSGNATRDELASFVRPSFKKVSTYADDISSFFKVSSKKVERILSEKIGKGKVQDRISELLQLLDEAYFFMNSFEALCRTIQLGSHTRDFKRKLLQSIWVC